MSEIIQFILLVLFCVVFLTLIVFIAIPLTKIAFELGDSLAEYWNNKLRDYLRRKLNK